MNKAIALILILMLTVSMGACGTASNESTQEQPSAQSSQAAVESSSEGAQAPAGDAVTLQFWGAIPPENGPEELVDTWNAANPGIQVEYTRFVNDDAGNTKLEAALMAGNVDVFINYPIQSFYKRLDAGLMLPLEDYFSAKGVDLVAEFGEANYNYNGHQYFIATLGGNNSYVMYNQDMFKEAGIIIPENWTWDDYADIAQQLTKGEGNDKVFGASLGSTVANDDWATPVRHYLNGDYIYKDGDDSISNFDDPLFLKAMKLRYRMENVDKSHISLIDIKATKMDVSAEYCRGNVGMLFANYALRDIKDLEKYPHDFITGFATAPLLAEGQTTVYSGGLREWITLSSKTAYPDEAFEFLWYYSTDGYYPMCRSNRFPAWKKADNEKVAELILGPNKDKVFDVQQFNDIVLANPTHVDLVTEITKGRAQIVTIMGEEFDRALLEEVTCEEAVESIKRRSDEALKNA